MGGAPPTGPNRLYDKACLLSQISAQPLRPIRVNRLRTGQCSFYAKPSAGFRDKAHMDKDSDLDALRGPDFLLLMMDLVSRPTRSPTDQPIAPLSQA